MKAIFGLTSRKPTISEQALLSIAQSLRSINVHLERTVKHMANLDDLGPRLSQLVTVGDGMKATMASLRDEVANLKQPHTDPETAAKIDALAATIDAKTAEWTEALKAGAAAEGEPAPTAEVPAEPTTPQAGEGG